MKHNFKVIQWRSGQRYLSTPLEFRPILNKHDIWQGEFLTREDNALLLTAPNSEWEITQVGDKIILQQKKSEDKKNGKVSKSK